MTNRSDARVQFLGNCMDGALAHNGYGFCEIVEYKWQAGKDSTEFRPDAHAVIVPHYGYDDDYDKGQQWRVTLDTFAHGIAVIRDAVLREVGGEGEKVLHNAKTGERLYLSEVRRKEIVLADRTNGDDGDLDVNDYLAILECALFGRVVYV